MKNRILFLDEIKGFAILLMVMGHVLAMNYANAEDIYVYSIDQTTNIKSGGVIWQLIYSFHMPLFFMVSGFLSYKVYTISDFPSFIKKKTTRLFIPWIFTFGLIHFIRSYWGYWFLLSLFELAIIGFFINLAMLKLNKKKNIITDVLFILALYFILHFIHVADYLYIEEFNFSCGKFVEYLLHYSVGMMLRRYPSVFSICTERQWFYTCALLLCVLLFTSKYMAMMFPFYIIHKYSYFPLSILASLLTFYMFKNGVFVKLKNIFSNLGKRSLQIYILHLFFIPHFTVIGDFILQQDVVNSITLQIITSLILSAITIGISLVAYKILSLSPLVRKLMFGEY